MISIKSAEYKLPVIVPLRKNKRFPSSANKPLLITGIDVESGIKADYVVKLIRAERMSGTASMRELLAAFIAMEFEIPVAQPAIIKVTQEFVDLLQGDEDHKVTSQSLGPNFGSKYVDKYQVFAVHQPLPNPLIPAALQIFAFDVFIQNSDRTHVKPNMITNGREIVILDHEIAFGFAFELPFLKNKEPWAIRQEDKLWIEKHCLYHTLKGEIFDQESLKSGLLRLDEAFWNRAWDFIPAPWRDKEQFETIKSYLTQIVGNLDSFVKNLQLLLA